MTRLAARRSFFATRRLLYGRKCRHHSGAATSVSLRLCAMIHAIASSTRGLICKSSVMLRTITPKLRAVEVGYRLGQQSNMKFPH
jgi:hypothetical protein